MSKKCNLHIKITLPFFQIKNGFISYNKKLY